MIHELDTCNPDDPQDNCILEEDASTTTLEVGWLGPWPAFVSVVKVCTRHQGLSGLTLYRTLVGEQQRRARVLTLAQAISPAIAWEDMGFRYTQAGALQVSPKALSPAQKSTLRSQANALLGPGRVEIL